MLKARPVWKNLMHLSFLGWHSAGKLDGRLTQLNSTWGEDTLFVTIFFFFSKKNYQIRPTMETTGLGRRNTYHYFIVKICRVRFFTGLFEFTGVFEWNCAVGNSKKMMSWLFYVIFGSHIILIEI